MRLRFPALLLLLSAAVEASPAAARPVVAVSVAPLGEIVTRLAGDAAEIVVLVPPGADVETFAPTVQQVAALERAALVFLVGDTGFTLEARLVEPWLARRPRIARVRLVDHVRGRPGSAPAAVAPAGHDDPHLWVSPRIVRAAAGELAARLAELLPGEAEAIGGRAVALAADIAALESRLASRLRGGGRFLVDHPALGHLARDFGLEQIAIEADGREPTPTQLARLVARARRDKFRVVLTQRSVARRGARTLAREIGAELVEIDPLAPDWLGNLERIGEALGRAVVRE